MAASAFDGKLVTLADVRQAGARVAGFVNRTPLITHDMLTEEAGVEALSWKCENLQKTGAFKARGAINAVRCITEREPSVRVFVTHSSGNHGQALAYACKRFGRVARVVVPKDAPAVKVAGLRRLGAEIIFCEPNQKAREAACARVLAASGGHSVARLLHPYDDPLVIAGQGTIGLEVLADGVFDAVIVPVGGGGLISGIATAVKGLDPTIRVIGAEPLMADDAARSFHDPTRSATPLPHREGCPNTIGDGLRAGLSTRTLAHLRAHVDDVVTVNEAEMRQAMERVLGDLKLVIEPSAAVGAAVALLPQFRRHLEGRKRVAVVLCGGNVDLRRIPAHYLPSEASASANNESKL